jgi:hypothetical protein
MDESLIEPEVVAAMRMAQCWVLTASWSVKDHLMPTPFEFGNEFRGSGMLQLHTPQLLPLHHTTHSSSRWGDNTICPTHSNHLAHPT